MMRPWNPAYREAWDAMSRSERRATAVFDLCVAAVVVSLMVYFG